MLGLSIHVWTVLYLDLPAVLFPMFPLSNPVPKPWQVLHVFIKETHDPRYQYPPGPRGMVVRDDVFQSLLPLKIVPNILLAKNVCLRYKWIRGAWVAPTLGFSSGRDLMVQEFEAHIRFPADGGEPVWDSLSLFLSLPLLHSCTHAVHLPPALQNK